MKKLEQPVHSQPEEHARSPLHPEPLVGDAHSGVSSHAQNMAHLLEKIITAARCILQVMIYSPGTQEFTLWKRASTSTCP
ncbi:hypothetical protein Q9233_007923 [Columba guinea]|nr:hypothetical protein Q9233_007923 [Columba guinea]